MTDKVVTVQIGADRRGLHGADDRQAHTASAGGRCRKLAGVLSIGDLVKEVIADREETIKQLECYIHRLVAG